MSPSFPCCCQGPLRNVSAPFCQSRSQSAKTHTNTQKVTLSFTQPLIKQTELWSPSCHYSSHRPSLTHLFVSLPRSLSPYLITPLSFPSLSLSTSLLLFLLLIFILLQPPFPCHLSSSHILPLLLSSCQASALYDYHLLEPSLTLRLHVCHAVFWLHCIT